jgi:flagellar export protein FliJ
MTTKFSQLAKLRKQKLESIEIEIAIANRQKRDALSNIQRLNEEINLVVIPKKGNFSEISICNDAIRSVSLRKKAQEELIVSIDKHLEELQKAYKSANIEYEKIKYLEERELQKRIKQIKLKESKELDEIANMLYRN